MTQRVFKLWLATGLLAAITATTYGQDAQTAAEEPRAGAVEADRLVEKAKNYPICKEYLPGSGSCKVTIDMRSQVREGEAKAMPNCPDKAPCDPPPWQRAHWDVTVDPAHPAWLYLMNKSPLLACSLTTSPAPLQRDSSAGFASLLTSLGGLGAPLSLAESFSLQAKELKIAREAGRPEEWLKAGRDLQTMIDREVIAAARDAANKARQAAEAADKATTAKEKAKEATDEAQKAAEEAKKATGTVDWKKAAEKASQAAGAADKAKQAAGEAATAQKAAKESSDNADRTKQLLADAGKPLSGDLAALIAKLKQLYQRVETAAEVAGQNGELPRVYDQTRSTLAQNWRYDYDSPDDAQWKVRKMWMALTTALRMQIQIPDTPQFAKDLDGIRADVIALGAKFEAVANAYAGGEVATQTSKWNEKFATWRDSSLNPPGQLSTGAIGFLAQGIQSTQANLAYVQAAQDLYKKAQAALVAIVGSDGSFLARHPTEQALAFGPFTQKQANVAVSCKDIATDKQPFDTVQFVAYFEKAPKWDFSAGALVSTLAGRQVGTVPGPLQPAGSQLCPADSNGNIPPCAPTTLAVTSSSSVQFMPMGFLEFHPWNFRCPWAHEGGGVHSRGYVCSLGPAFGFTVNPNNGSPTAEFFEGVSLGIHRVALLVGVHNGRSQEFGEGYSVGQTLPPGVSVTPPTTLLWKNAVAFGISYRIPLR